MLTDIEGLLNQLDINKSGHYDNQFYVIDLADSNEYATMYSHLEDVAVNTENPSIGTNTNNTTVAITNYFETEYKGVNHDIFLIADFTTDTYKVKIGEK